MICFAFCLRTWEQHASVNKNKSHTFEKEDFVRCAFPKDWDILIDKLGDGVKVAFPIKVRSFLSKSRKNHSQCEGQIMYLNVP
jgi:hypothetical protein